MRQSEIKIFTSFVLFFLLTMTAAAVFANETSSQVLSFTGDVPGNHSSTRLVMPAEKNPVSAFDTKSDHQASIFDLKGDVRILKHGTDQWTALQKDTTIEVGDQILTAKNSYVDVAYDSYFLNIARIEENTKAEFLNIEPTMIRLEDGSIFSALDGLAKGSKYEIATPTAVAGVRGTRWFASFSAVNNAANFGTLPEEGEHSIVVTGEGNSSVIVPEEKVVTINFAQPADEGLLKEMPADLLQKFSGVQTEIMGKIPAEALEARNRILSEIESKADDPPQPSKDDSEKNAGDGNPPNGSDEGPLDDSASDGSLGGGLRRENAAKGFEDKFADDALLSERLKPVDEAASQGVENLTPDGFIRRERFSGVSSVKSAGERPEGIAGEWEENQSPMRDPSRFGKPTEGIAPRDFNHDLRPPPLSEDRFMIHRDGNLMPPPVDPAEIARNAETLYPPPPPDCPAGTTGCP